MTHLNNPQINIYTDGSWSDNYPEISGWAYVAVHPERMSMDGKNKQIVRIDSGVAPADSRQIGGELKAVMAAVNWSVKLGLDTIAIHYDYEGVEKWATGEWKAKKQLSKLYSEWLSAQSINIQFIKVAAHTGNLYNDLADVLAKEARTK